MNILYLCADRGIPVRGHKGSAIHLRALSDAFCSLGHMVTLVAPRGGPEDGPPPRARFIETGLPELPEDAAPVLRELAAQSIAEQVYKAAYEITQREHFDLVYERYSLWSQAGSHLSAATGLPLVVEVNAPLRVEAARYRSLIQTDLAARIEAEVLQTAAALVAVSASLKGYLVEQGAPPEKVHVLPNAVDEQLFHPAVDGTELRLRLGLADKFVIGFVGTVRPWHDLDTLIAAVAQLSEDNASPPLLRGGLPGAYHLLLVGDIPDSVRASIESHGLSGLTTIVDPVPNSAVPAYLAAMDAAVSPHPALPDFYFSPLKLSEYLACGLATVAAALPPVAEVISSGVNGLLYEPGDAGDLASALAALAADPALRERLGTHGSLDVLRGHTWKHNAAQVISLVEKPAAGVWPDPLLQDRPPENAAPLLDDRMPRLLYRATRADLAGPSLSRSLASATGEAAYELKTLEVLKYKPGRRCVIAYGMAPVDPAGSKRALIGKVFHDERGQEQLVLQQALRADGFGPGAPGDITVPEPIAYIPEMHMLLQERAPGETLDACLGKEGFAGNVKASARAIARLHALPLRLPKAYPLQAELGNLQLWAIGLIALRPQLAATFTRHLEHLQALAGELPPTPPAPVHRDFHYGQVVFSGPRLTLIDLDLLAMGDPAIDVANFAAHLQFLAIQFLPEPYALDRMAELFVAEYLQARGDRPGDGFERRLAFYEAATFFRLLHVALTRPAFTRYFDPLLQICNYKTQLAEESL